MGEVLELTLSLVFELFGALIFDRFAECSLRWLKIW
jgi:hypothetical protein